MTRTSIPSSVATAALAAHLITGCGPTKRPIVGAAEQVQAAASAHRFRILALDPAAIPPPGVDPGPVLAASGPLAGRARLIRAEQAAWNQWGPDAAPLLFNDRAALIFEVEVQAEGELVWRSDRSWLEVNSPETRLPALSGPEPLLAELQWYALQQEKWVLEGDLVQRTRHAGGFRDAYFHPVPSGFAGVVAFALDDPERHVGAMRLTVAMAVDAVPVELVWVFQ